jgi:hypothetical protein
MLPISRHWVRFSSFFGHRILEQKTKHEDTKEDADTKTRRIRISARGARKWIISLCLTVLVVGLMTAFCSHGISFARSGFGHKAEQFSHEQIWQKPERSLGKRRSAQMA